MAVARRHTGGCSARKGECKCLSSLAVRAQGNEHDALQAGAPTSALAPSWRMMLLSNGSVTRHLELLTGVKVEVVRAAPRLKRQVGCLIVLGEHALREGIL